MSKRTVTTQTELEPTITVHTYPDDPQAVSITTSDRRRALILTHRMTELACTSTASPNSPKGPHHDTP